MQRSVEQWRRGGRWFDYLGFRVFYARAGAESPLGPPLLLVHGYPFSSFDWTAIWDRLTERFDVIAPDMLGMGFSDKPERYAYSVHDHADMHEALLDELDVHDCHVLAHDLGDSVAQELLARHEQRATKLALRSITWLNGGLFNEAYTPRPIQRLLSTTPVGDVAARFPRLSLSDAVLRRALAELFGPRTQPSDEMLAAFTALLDWGGGRRVTHKVGRFILDRRTHRNRWVRAMRATAVPMRLIDGPHDPNSGRHMAERYRELIPDADVVMLADDIGHWPQLEAPDVVVDAFLDFVPL